MKRWKKIIKFFVVGCCIIGIVISHKPSTDNTPIQGTEAMVDWLTLLCDGKVDILDNSEIERYLSDSIVRISLERIVLKNNQLFYDIEVVLTPYQELTTLSLDEKAIKEFKQGYVENDLADDIANAELLDLYERERIRNCYKRGTSNIVLNLTIRGTDIGKISLINTILEKSNILRNTKYFEDYIYLSIKEVINE